MDTLSLSFKSEYMLDKLASLQKSVFFRKHFKVSKHDCSKKKIHLAKTPGSQIMKVSGIKRD
jgi:hypothetical protein